MIHVNIGVRWSCLSYGDYIWQWFSRNQVWHSIVAEWTLEAFLCLDWSILCSVLCWPILSRVPFWTLTEHICILFLCMCACALCVCVCVCVHSQVEVCTEKPGTILTFSRAAGSYHSLVLPQCVLPLIFSCLWDYALRVWKKIMAKWYTEKKNWQCVSTNAVLKVFDHKPQCLLTSLGHGHMDPHMERVSNFSRIMCKYGLGMGR